MIKCKDYRLNIVMIKLICLSPKIAFSEIIEQKPRMILYTSGTLPKKEEAEEMFGINFSINKSFSLKNEHKLYLSTISKVGDKIL